MSLAEGSEHAGWTIKSLLQDGAAPRYAVERDGEAGSLTYFPFTGPQTVPHQHLSDRLKSIERVTHELLVPLSIERTDDGLCVAQPETERLSEEPLDEKEACVTLKAIATALGAFHSKNLAHGELDPWCVVKVKGEVRLQPPGLRLAPIGVKKLGLEVDPRYASPEVLDGISATPQSDMFSLGLVLYRLLLGKPPVAGADPSEAFAARCVDHAPAMKRATPIKAPVTALYDKLTAPRPEQRPQNAQELVDDLSAVIDNAQSPQRNPLPATDEIASVGIGVPLVFLLLMLGLLGYLYIQATTGLTTESPAEAFTFPRPGAAAKTQPGAEKTTGAEKTGAEKTGAEKTGAEKTTKTN